MKFFIIFIMFFQFACSGQTESSKKIIQSDRETKILILGDSLTEGYGISKQKAYPHLLQEKFNKKGHKVEIVNAGSSGSTSASALGRLKWHLQSKPNVLVLALGANDGLRGVRVLSMKKNLEQTIELAKKNEMTVYLAGMKLPLNYGKSYREAFERVFSDLAKEKNVKLIPFLLENVAGIKKYNLPDGLHPNEKGHELIADTVFKILEKGL